MRAFLAASAGLRFELSRAALAGVTIADLLLYQDQLQTYSEAAAGLFGHRREFMR